MIRPEIRIEGDGLEGHRAHVFYVDGETKTEISSCVKGVDIRMRVGEINTATLYVLLAGGHINAEVEEVIVERFEGRKWRQRRFKL